VSPLQVCHLGSTSYREGLALQEGLVQARAAGRTGDWLLYPDHPPVLTVGRQPSDGNIVADPATLRARGVEVFEVARGGEDLGLGAGRGHRGDGIISAAVPLAVVAARGHCYSSARRTSP